MPEVNDIELLDNYARDGSEAAFAELVQRHVSLVYSVALRHVRNAAHADEITQSVFMILARQGGHLLPKTVLEGWLYSVTRLVSLNFLRGERRRQFHEQEAYMQSTLQETTGEPAWNEFAPLLDAAMARLRKKDRDAIILRFFKGKSVRDVATALRIKEPAAQRRVLRALERLRSFFAKQGVHSTTAIIAGALSSNSVQAAPPALAQSVTAAAIAKGATVGGSTLTLMKGALKVMAWTKATKTATVIGVGIVLTVGTTFTVSEIKKHTRYSWQMPNLRLAMIRQYPPQITIVPTIFDQPSYCSDFTKGGGAIEICASVTDLVRTAYAADTYRMVFEPDLQTNRYDFLARGADTDWSDKWTKALQEKLKSKLDVVVKPEVRDTDVLLLEYTNPNAGGLRAPGSLRRSMRLPGYMETIGTNFLACFASPISSLQDFLQGSLQIPIIDQTGLNGRYDFKLTYDPDPTRYRESIKQAVYDQLGFELVPTNMPYEMLVVDRAK